LAWERPGLAELEIYGESQNRELFNFGVKNRILMDDLLLMLLG